MVQELFPVPTLLDKQCRDRLLLTHTAQTQAHTVLNLAIRQLRRVMLLLVVANSRPHPIRLPPPPVRERCSLCRHLKGFLDLLVWLNHTRVLKR